MGQDRVGGVSDHLISNALHAELDVTGLLCQLDVLGSVVLCLNRTDRNATAAALTLRTAAVTRRRVSRLRRGRNLERIILLGPSVVKSLSLNCGDQLLIEIALRNSGHGISAAPRQPQIFLTFVRP